jgi:hypothetical protein
MIKKMTIATDIVQEIWIPGLPNTQKNGLKWQEVQRITTTTTTYKRFYTDIDTSRKIERKRWICKSGDISKDD